MNNIQNYNIENLRNEKFWVKTSSQEDWNRVCEVFQRAGIKWSNNEEASSLNYTKSKGILYNQGGDPKLTHGSNSSQHEVIPTDQFLNDNQPTDMTTTEKIEALEKQLQELKESLNWKPKVGDWVYVISGGAGAYGANNRIGKYTDKKCTDGKTDSEIRVQIGSEIWGLTNNGVPYKLRKATSEEIERANPKEIKVTIGTEGKEVVISKGKIVAPDGKEVAISDINMMCGIMIGTRGFNSWTVTFPEVKIGCIESISYDQLKAVQEAYEKLTNN